MNSSLWEGEGTRTGDETEWLFDLLRLAVVSYPAPCNDMNELPISGFLEAIHATHGATARYLGPEYVEERFEDEPVWEGEVLVFELDDHPTATLERGRGGHSRAGGAARGFSLGSGQGCDYGRGRVVKWRRTA